jgi:hypothetical protein
VVRVLVVEVEDGVDRAAPVMPVAAERDFKSVAASLDEPRESPPGSVP